MFEKFQCQVVLHDLYWYDDQHNLQLNLKRGDWIEAEGYVGVLGYKQPSNAPLILNSDGKQETFLVAAVGTPPYEVTIPMSALSKNCYISSKNLWIARDPDPRSNNLTLVEVTEGARHDEGIVVPLSVLARHLDTTVENLIENDLVTLVLALNEDGIWFDPEDETRHQESVDLDE